MKPPACTTCLWRFLTWRDYLYHLWLHFKEGR